MIKTTKVEKNLFFKNLFKIGYSKKTPFRKKYLKNITIAFQRKYRQDLVNGNIDRECLIISTHLLNKQD